MEGGADIIESQELRWAGIGLPEKNNYTIYYSNQPANHVVGAAFLVTKKLNLL